MRWLSRPRLVVLAAILLGGGGACGGGDGGPGGVRPDAATSGPDGAPPAADAALAVSIEYLDPDHGPFAGGTEALLRGHGFADGMEVLVGGRLVEPLDLEIIDERRALIRTPPGEPGDAPVEVRAQGLVATSEGAFRYEAVYADPPSGSIAGGTFVRLRGLGTGFADGDTVTFDGAPMTGVVVVNEQEIAGYTPAGAGGTADVVIVGAAGVVTADDAFTYELTANPSSGGLGGGPIAGTVNVSVVDRLSRNGIDGAFVTLGDPATATHQGLTDDFGHITFSAPGLVGPLTVVASKPGYERGAFVSYDAAEATIWLLPVPDPMPPDPGPFPPGRRNGTISGEIIFGDVTGLGEPTWDLVPEPRVPGERKRALVFTTSSSPFSGTPAPGPGGTIEYVADGRIAWEFSITARPAALAVVAVAGLYDEALDPDGDGPRPAGVFYPFVMGVARGVVVGADEDVEHVSVTMDIPLDAALPIQLGSPPPLLAPGEAFGPDRYQARAYIDLGGEGVVKVPGHVQTFAPGQTAIVMSAMPPLVRAIGDASYTIITGAYSGDGGAPFSVRVERGLDDLGAPIVIDGFLGVPRALDPAPGAPLPAASRLHWAPEGATTGVPVFSYHTVMQAQDGIPLWRLFARGGLRDLPLYDLVTWAGMTPVPSPDDLIWTIYEIAIPGLDFDVVSYGHINANLWSAYANAAYVVQLPPQ